MKPLPALLLLFLLTLLPLAAQVRTFTNAKGEEISAELIGATDSRAELRRADGKRFSVPLTSLSEADRNFIAEWRKTHRQYKVQVQPAQRKGNTREETDPIAGATKGNDCWYVLTVRNTAAEPLAGLRIDYLVYPPGDSGASPLPGSVEVPTIPVGKSGSVATAKLFVPQRRTVERSGLANAVRFTENSLAGVYLILSIDGKPVGAMPHGTVPPDAAAALNAWREQQKSPEPLPAEKQPDKMIERTNIATPPPVPGADDPPVATFSIVARDPDTGELGVAVQSRVLGVGAIVPFARAGVGAIATQSYANVRYGPDGLRLLAEGKPAADTLAALTGPDPKQSIRQAAVIAPAGPPATFTGDACMPWAGGRTGTHYAAQGNILAGEAVVAAMADTFEKTSGTLAVRLLAALDAAQAAGGDKRGMQSAALLVVREGWGYAGQSDRYMDLRIDDHPAPLTELRRLHDLHLRTFPRPEPARKEGE